MKKIFSLSLLACVFLFVNSAAFAADRVIYCSNKAGTVEIRKCSGVGCPVIVTQNNKAKSYNLRRTKNSDGSYSYAAKAGSRPACSIRLSSFRFGKAALRSISCGSRLVRSKCVVKESGSSSSVSQSSESSQKSVSNNEANISTDGLNF